MQLPRASPPGVSAPPRTTPSPEARGGARALSLVVAGVVAAVFGMKLLLIRSFGSPVPSYDQWMSQARLIYIPFFDHYLKVRYFWVPHNEHRVVFTRLLNFFLTLANGQWDTRLEMTVNALIHAGFAGALVAFASRLVRGWGLVVVAAVVLAVFVVPGAWENTLGGFQSAFYFLCWSALGELWLCTTAGPLDRRWWCGYGVGLLGLGTMGTGFLSSAAVLAVLCLGVLGKRRMTGGEAGAAILLAGLSAAGAFLLSHHVPGADIYRATSLRAGLGSAAYAFGWPMGRTLAAALCVQAPLAWLASRLICGRHGSPFEWTLLGLGIWGWVQMGALAYTRATAIETPRYADVFALSLIANSLALVYLMGGRRLAPVVLAIWLALLAGGLAGVTAHALADLRDYRALEAVKAQHIQAFMATGDAAVLRSAPARELPYPEPDTLARMLTNPGMRPMLPKELQAPADWRGYGLDSLASHALQACGPWIAALGILLAGLGFARLRPRAGRP